ncbi:site-2 protease family protein [Corallococcus sp. H22C18031201]|uniref:site-2 protease family protein n=1 Tax=Citreicoccus inhibens TaxID=2849499 RepID=UPI000E70E269|nr:site-2 protease family protein [Citreicoccus inhibens]MBU8898435.1 site-2 protease family protein [Citreicoccus inhibens]RJS21284.1 site-2 protease family protein [Corallococcus sp. H22C18031201]
MDEALAVATRCEGCGSELGPRLLTCPSCLRLVHARTLQRLAAEAEAATARQALTEALGAWRQALDLLPAGTSQHAQVMARVEALSRQVDVAGAGSSADSKSARAGMPKALAGLGAFGVALWKFKFALLFLLGKGKLLLLGLTQASTLFSMLLAMGVYWTAWGWVFAVGLVASIYVHEMGHVAALRRFGMQSSAPMFIPGLGALVRLKQAPVDAREDARVGLAGPIWGGAAAVLTFVAALATGWKSLGAIAHAAAWLNVFNLLPLWQLDGGRGFRALSRKERWWAVAAVGGAWFLTHESLFVLLLAGATFRALLTPAPEEGDTRTLVEYVGLVLVLGAVGWLAQEWTGAALAM